MKRILLFAASALAAVTIQAKVVTTQQAQSLAKQFRQTQAARSGIASTLAETDMKLAYAPQGSEYYVFNGAGNTGYVIVSGDDCAAPILGYSDNGSFNADKMPPAMKTWLGIYARQVTAAAESGIKYEATTTTDHEPIPHLLTTIWDQVEPFNDLCPLDSKGQRTITGCVATAMAQVVNYHKWPVQARGTATAMLLDDSITISRDMSADVFDWDNMLNAYTDIYASPLPDITDEQRAAVALLMVDMGYSVGMKYSVQVSGANDLYVPGALIDHFNYDKATHIECKDWYSEAQWDSIIYNELANARPVIMGGNVTEYEGGHMFVCEGYEGDGFYWINWGWGGAFDGKFLLSALNVVEDPSWHFNANVAAIVGVQKPQEGSDYVWTLGNKYSIHADTDEETGEVNIVFGLVNYSALPFEGDMALRVTNTATGETKHFKIELDHPLRAGFFIADESDSIINPLPDGVYKISTEYRPLGGEWTLSRVKLGNAKELTLTVSGGKRTYSTPDDASTINAVTDGMSTTTKREVFDIHGVRLATLEGNFQPAALRSGIYIIKTTDSRGGTTTSKYIAK